MLSGEGEGVMILLDVRCVDKVVRPAEGRADCTSPSIGAGSDMSGGREHCGRIDSRAGVSSRTEESLGAGELLSAGEGRGARASDGARGRRGAGNAFGAGGSFGAKVGIGAVGVPCVGAAAVGGAAGVLGAACDVGARNGFGANDDLGARIVAGCSAEVLRLGFALEPCTPEVPGLSPTLTRVGGREREGDGLSFGFFGDGSAEGVGRDSGFAPSCGCNALLKKSIVSLMSLSFLALAVSLEQ